MKPIEGRHDQRSHHELTHEVLAFLEGEIGGGRIDIDMDIRRDLGIDGDDAGELLERFSEAFRVDFAPFRYSDYFGPESGFEPITWFFSKLNGSTKPLKPLTVRTLVNSAERGRFFPE